MSGALVARGALVYLAAVNTGSAALFGYDKYLAGRPRTRRISERRLCQTALVGGWPGGLLAMQMFRHKTVKKSFQKKYVDAITTNTVYSLPVVVLLLSVPSFRNNFSNEVLRAFGRAPPPPRRWGGGRKPPRMRR